MHVPAFSTRARIRGTRRAEVAVKKLHELRFVQPSSRRRAHVTDSKTARSTRVHRPARTDITHSVRVPAPRSSRWLEQALAHHLLNYSPGTAAPNQLELFGTPGSATRPVLSRRNI